MIRVLLAVFSYQFLVCLSLPYKEVKVSNFGALDESYTKIKAGILKGKRNLKSKDLSKEFEALDKFYNDIKASGIDKKENLHRFKRQAEQDADSIEKCCEIIKNYIEKKKDSHDILCAESEEDECCNKFADEIKKKEDVYDTLCPSNDKNECELYAPCAKNATCVNTDGSFTCTCTDGFNGDGYRNCFDKNECAESTTCNVEATCSNSVGSYKCTCNAGFTGDGHQCSDVDECQMDSENSCTNMAACTNTIGSYKCECNHGYTWNGKNCGLEFLIYHPYTKKCMAPAGNELQLVNCNQLDGNQQWSWGSSMTHLKNKATGKCIEEPSNAKELDNLQIQSCDEIGKATQQWRCNGKQMYAPNSPLFWNYGIKGENRVVLSRGVGEAYEWEVYKEGKTICAKQMG